MLIRFVLKISNWEYGDFRGGEKHGDYPVNAKSAFEQENARDVLILTPRGLVIRRV